MTNRVKKAIIPQLRFPEFSDSWEVKKVGSLMTESKINGGNGLSAKKITVKLWGKGVFPKNEEGSPNTNYYKRTAGQIIYSKLDFLNCAFGIIPKSMDGYESTADLPALDISPEYDAKFILEKIKQKNFYEKYGATADGTRKAKRVHVDTFLSFPITVPNIVEQQKISSFFSLIDDLLILLNEEKKCFEKYKEGVLQQVFNLSANPSSDLQINFSEWKEVQLADILAERVERNEVGHEEVFSVAKQAGVVNQIEHLGRSYAAQDISKYKVVKPDDIVYTKSPTADFPFGIVKQNRTGRTGVVSVLYGVFKPKNKYLAYLLHEYFTSPVRAYNYLVPIVHKGAKNTINVKNSDFIRGKTIFLPTLLEELEMFCNFLSKLDELIINKARQIELMEKWKKGLLKKMYI